MKDQSRRPVGEIIWMFQTLRRVQKEAPKRQWTWAAASPNFDRTELLQNMRLEATIDASEIWQALRAKESSGHWPKISARAQYFLRERISAALDLCSAWLKKRSPMRNAELPCRPSDAESFARDLLIDYWDKTAVDEWMEANQDSFQEPDEDEDECS